MPSTTRPTSTPATRSTAPGSSAGETPPAEIPSSTEPTTEGGSSSGLLGGGARLLADFVSAVDPRKVVGRVGGQRASIPVDEQVEGDAVVFEAELPGFAAEDIAVAAQNGRLILHAERAAPAEGRGTTVATPPRRERTGPLARELDLPPGTDPAQIDARYADGLLVVRVPLPAPSSTERVEIPVRHSS